MAKSKKKPTAPNIAFIERIEIQIKEKSRQRMLKRAPKPAGQQSTDILNQQYLLQRALAQRMQPQQQTQSVNIYLGDIAKLQQQETLKRIDEDASAAILRQQRGGINQERLDFVLSSLLQEKQQLKKAGPVVAPEEFRQPELAVQYKEEIRAASVAALERMNKAQGPRSVAFESTPILQPRQQSADPSMSRRRAITPTQRRELSIEASETASALSRMTAEELATKYPDLTQEILTQSKEQIKRKYKARQTELQAEVESGRTAASDANQLLRDYASVIGYQAKPRIKETRAPSALTETQEQQFPKTAALLKKSSTSSAELTASLSANLKPSTLSEQIPAAAGGGQVEQIEAAKIKSRSTRQRAAILAQPNQPTIMQAFGKASSAAESLVIEGGQSSPRSMPATPLPTPPSSRPTTGESFTRQQPQTAPGGILPRV